MTARSCQSTLRPSTIEWTPSPRMHRVRAAALCRCGGWSSPGGSELYAKATVGVARWVVSRPARVNSTAFPDWVPSSTRA